LDDISGLINIKHNAPLHAFRHSFAHAQNFELAVLVFAAHQGANFRGAYVETDDDFILLHGNGVGSERAVANLVSKLYKKQFYDCQVVTTRKLSGFGILR
jgi:hypothetical protein